MMLVKSIVNILDEITLSNMEEKYKEIYSFCQSDAFNESDACSAVGLIQSRYVSSNEDVFRSYYLLFLGAILDSGKFNASIDSVVEFLVKEVTTLNDFRVKDENQNYIHYLSHAIYLASSLLENNLCIKTQLYELADVLVGAYLRCEAVFSYNEDLILADFLLKMKPSHEKSVSLVQRLSPKQSKEMTVDVFEVAKDTNKKILWMSMFTLNFKYKVYRDEVFSDSVTHLVERYFE